jgi:hypothetical protein
MQWVLEAVLPGVKRAGREADHSLPSSVEAKHGGAIPHAPSWGGAYLSAGITLPLPVYKGHRISLK